MLVVVSEGTEQLNVIASNGTMIDFGLHFGTPEMLSFVPLNLGFSGNPLEGFYAANYSYNVIKAGASEFSAYKGDAVPRSATLALFALDLAKLNISRCKCANASYAVYRTR